MTSKVALPEDGSFVQITDGTNNAWVSGDCRVAIGDDEPDESSATHALPTEGIVIYSPVIMWARIGSSLSPVISVSTW